ncbi:uncharacterized protein [Rutidosis leptorrhynchoides]|uniref:uncharacterized protein n=1 Tax=Rutidosis leptorrhynchoides TaxID=125765 RepID=UPI003A992BF0
MKILSLNIRGFGCDDTVESKISKFRRIRLSKLPDVVSIQASKCNEVSDSWLECVWGGPDFEFVQKPKMGKSEGLLLIWDPGVFNVNQAVVKEFFLAIKGHWIGKDMETIIVNVYGPHNDENKKRMWDSLEQLKRYDNAAWVICGDFNEVWDQTKRQNCVFIKRRASLFNDFIERMQLIEIPLLGKKFTRISDDRSKLSILDRFLVSDDFLRMWGDISTLALDRSLSDHCPIILRDKNDDFGSKPFKFFDMWLEFKDVEPIIVAAWNKKGRWA